MIKTKATTFQYVQESSEAFLPLFPHRYDFIYAPHPEPKQKPNWQTETRYPLSDRHLLAGEYLYGVRFEKKTSYFLLDIDRKSPYHPSQSPCALNRLFEALEPLGLCDRIICTSSDSNGLHIYFPISKPFKSWELGKAVSVALEDTGFKFKPGNLEIFPNPKAYISGETPSLFNAHRLPLQMGSYILNDELQPINSSHAQFVRMWRFCQRRNAISTRQIRRLIKKSQIISYRLSTKASKFLADLNLEIEQGWTDYGQTNRLLGRIAMRSFVFNHITEGGKPLEGADLIEKIVSVAKALPGYKDWCRHQHEIKERAAEWARCIENSHYFAYGTAKGKYKELSASNQIDSELDYNQQKAKETQSKIADAIQDLVRKQELPKKATARFKALLKYSIGGASLYRYRELWHPIELTSSEILPPESGLQKTDFEDACTGGANDLKNPTSLLHSNASNFLSGKGSTDSIDASEEATEGNSSNPAKAVRDRIKKQLAETQKARRIAQNSSLPPVDEVAVAIHKRALQRMREFLLSGEPILLIEVGQWLIKQPPAVRDELASLSDRKLNELILDLGRIAECLVQINLSPWSVRFELEAEYQKSLILDLSDSERRHWLGSLVQRLQSENSS